MASVLKEVRIGALGQIQYPAFMPYDARSPWGMLHNNASLAIAADICEGVALQALSQHTVGKARIVLFESTPSRYFTQIKRLIAQSNQQWGEQLFNASACVNRLVEWEELVRRRFDLLAQVGVHDIYSYNAQAAYAEPIFYLVLNGLGALAEASHLAKVQVLCHEGGIVGIVPLLLINDDDSGSDPNFFDRRFNVLKNFWDNVYPIVTGLNVRKPQVPVPINVPLKIWQLLTRFDLQLGLGSLSQVWVANLLEKIKSVDDANVRHDFLNIRIGLTGATPAFFTMGAKSLVYHAFIAGTNGSGKTNLLNNIILGSCENYSPDQLQLTLMDFKFGISFKQYAGLAHIARLYSPVSPNYKQALQYMLQISQEMEQRYKILSAASVKHIDEYNATAVQPIPHHLVIIDEVHRPVQEDSDWNRQEAFKLQLISIAKQGRAAGVHLILCTQSYDRLGLDKVSAEVRLRIGLRLADLSDCAALMGLQHGNNVMATLPDFTAVYNAHLGETKHNRIVVLDEVPTPNFKTRLAALKNRYPSPVTASMVAEVEPQSGVVASAEEQSNVPSWLR